MSTAKHDGLSWPLFMNYTKADCQRILRKLELEAYAKMITVFRAQGPLTRDKRKILNDLQRLLSIATDRHKFEVRRALYDVELTKISKSVHGCETDQDWFMEGRRIAPLLRRAIPETAFLSNADVVASQYASSNLKILQQIGNKYSKKMRPRTEIRAIEHPSKQTPNSNFQESFENPGFAKTTVATSINQSEKAVLSNSVPEAAIEVTCEANAHQDTRKSYDYKEKSDPLSDTYTQKEIRQENSESQEFSTSNFHNVNESNDLQCTTSSPPGCVVNASLKSAQRVKAAPISPIYTSVYPENSLQNPKKPLSVDIASGNNGLMPLISSSRNIFIRQNLGPTASPISLHGSQGIQVAKMHGSIPIVTVPSFSRVSPAVVASTKPSLTTVVVTGTAATNNFVAPTTTTPLLMKNYTSVFPHHQTALPASYLSASSILADNKIQVQNHQVPAQQSIIVQQHLQSTVSPSGNVVVVHRGAANRLVPSNASGSAPVHVSTTKHFPVSSPPTAISVVSTKTRPVRILPVPASVVMPVTHTATGTANSTFPPLLSASHPPYSNQTNYRVTGSNAVVRNDYEQTTTTGTANAIKRSLASGSSTSSNASLLALAPSLPNVASSTSQSTASSMSTQANSPALISVLELKRPRLAFAPAPTTPARQ